MSILLSVSLQQGFGHPFMDLQIGFNELKGLSLGSDHYIPNFLINFLGCQLAVIPVLGNLPA